MTMRKEVDVDGMDGGQRSTHEEGKGSKLLQTQEREHRDNVKMYVGRRPYR